jgi:hypothetical protein
VTVGGGSRTARLPFDHLLAEIAAAPLASSDSFAGCVTSLDPNMGGGTARLWRSTEQSLVASFPGLSLNELIQLRDETWFAGARARPVSMGDYLRSVSCHWLEARDGELVPRSRPTSPETHSGQASARQALRWLSLSLPLDLVAAASPLGARGAKVAGVNQSISRELADQGFAETHLHVGASLNFSQLWRLLMIRMASAGAALDFRAPGAQFAEGADLFAWTVRSAVVRYLLAAYLDRPASSFSAFVSGSVRQRLVAAGGPGDFALVLLALTDLRNGCLDERLPVESMLGLYRVLTGNRPRQIVDQLDELSTLDPIVAFRGIDRCGEAERSFATACIEAIRTNPADRALGELFWQYERVRCILYRHVTQRPMTPGLQWFVRFYGRMSRVRGASVSTRALLDAAARPNEGMRSLEVRTTPESDETLLVSQIREMDNWAEQHANIEFGVVFHFSKSRGQDARQGRPSARGLGSTADPQAPQNGGFRFGHYAQERAAEAATLASVIRRYPLSLMTIRGLDVCSDETAVPAWVLAPAFRLVREAASQATSQLRLIEGQDGLVVPQPLRATAHAGEDFVHLITGLRQIDEAITCLELAEGDRLGHAVALGIDPDDWALRAGQVPMRLEDRVLDLAWESGWYGRHAAESPQGRLAFLHREVPALGEQWLGRTTSLFDLEHLQQSLATASALSSVGFPDRPWLPNRPASRTHDYLHFYLTDRGVFDRGHDLVWVNAAAEAQATEILQHMLRTKVGRLGLTIEVNPTSNLLIGDLADLERHPLWRLRSPVRQSQQETGERLAICVGSDDPTVFCSDLPGEYQLLHDALVLAGTGDADATLWLREVRETSLNCRFTYPADRHLRFDHIIRPG